MQKQSRKELLDKIEQDAYKYELEYHGCSRCTLAPLQDHLGLGNALTIQASVPLSGGIARTGNTCGALIGGLMAIGLAFASADRTDKESLFKTLEIAKRYYRLFEREIGNTLCRDIRVVRLGRFFDTVDPDEYQKFAKAGGHEECAKVIAKAARLAAEFILDEREKMESEKAGKGKTGNK